METRDLQSSMANLNLEHEFGDVMAWLAWLANLEGVDLETAVARYAATCPWCGDAPCGCPFP